MIKVENISVKLDDFKTNYSMDVDNGEWIGIIGQSGSGKSTLLNLIAGFIYADSGSIRINSVEMNSTHPSERPVSCLFQENNLFPHLSVYENIAIGISPRLKLNASEKKEVQEILDYLNLSDKHNSDIGILSGGERQRVAIGRIVLSNKKILLLDEPFSQLDPNLRIEMLSLIRKIKDEKKLTIIMVLHTPIEAVSYVDRFIQIKNGRIERNIKPTEYSLDIT